MGHADLTQVKVAPAPVSDTGPEVASRMNRSYP